MGGLEHGYRTFDIGREGIQWLFNDQLHADRSGKVDDDVGPSDRSVDRQFVKDRTLHKVEPWVVAYSTQV